ncbi:hypothetical protein SODALDRAFT_358796 [Sodiomyces alkalinus F11]|uniref:Transcription factor domain-containing protein n=1 Tax=Sodiomyces alkalinus (strain CBS 110278 / VKM F-3762 / F11) TaxID=1314773 RepID=A0A3N2PWR5_SODAK|nr:hypothetical protein SODALDRAFT_358796 [Sodiomyces alkalinus F11]ROT38961.1 hypothetical protein SODALDRAFT_358796 [Sodiomyces alkalinus F11]
MSPIHPQITSSSSAEEVRNQEPLDAPKLESHASHAGKKCHYEKYRSPVQTLVGGRERQTDSHAACVLPRRHLERLFLDAAVHPSLGSVVAVVRFIGAIYGRSDRSAQLREQARRNISCPTDSPGVPHADPFLVQARLLFSIALFWSSDEAETQQIMDGAVSLALDLPTLYIVDAYYADMQRSMNYPTRDLRATVGLPCEETDMNWACLIDAVDAIIDGWLLLLPESKRHVMTKEGVVDELMFQAQMVCTHHRWIIGCHRQHSALLFHPLEIISSCATGGPDNLLAAGELVNIHTTRCLRSIEAQIRPLALPARSFRHTPFTDLHGDDGDGPPALGLQVPPEGREAQDCQAPDPAEHRLPQGAGGLLAAGGPERNVREIQHISQEVLGLAPKTGSSDSVDCHESSMEGSLARDAFSFAFHGESESSTQLGLDQRSFQLRAMA